ncbi:MAG: SAM-dependent methyltransferase, partial [Pontimonas sp.]
MSATRLDVALVVRGLASTRTKAQRLIAQGLVRVAGHPATKPALAVAHDTVIDIVAGGTESERGDVGRGAVKLRAALSRWAPPVRGSVCVDVGASTGGFTQVLLEWGATAVIALDVGHGQLDPALRAQARVTNLEGVHAGHICASWWQEQALPAPVGVVVADVSFISLTKIIPALVDTFGVHSHYV